MFSPSMNWLSLAMAWFHYLCSYVMRGSSKMNSQVKYVDSCREGFICSRVLMVVRCWQKSRFYWIPRAPKASLLPSPFERWNQAAAESSNVRWESPVTKNTNFSAAIEKTGAKDQGKTSSFSFLLKGRRTKLTGSIFPGGRPMPLYTFPEMILVLCLGLGKKKASEITYIYGHHLSSYVEIPDFLLSD